jgi:hypothetical protein
MHCQLMCQRADGRRRFPFRAVLGQAPQRRGDFGQRRPVPRQLGMSLVDHPKCTVHCVRIDRAENPGRAPVPEAATQRQECPERLRLPLGVLAIPLLAALGDRQDAVLQVVAHRLGGKPVLAREVRWPHLISG